MDEMGKFHTLVLDNQGMIIGATLAIVGNLLISISMNLQKYALTRLQTQAEITERNTQETTDPSSKTTNQSSSFLKEYGYLRSKLWLFAIALMIFGEVGNFMAYGFAPASVVAPLGTTTVVANTYIATFLLGEKFRCQDALGTLVIVVGAFLIVLFANFDDVRLDAVAIYHHLVRWPFLIYIGVEVILFVVMNYLLFYRRIKHVVIFILSAALLASVTVIAAKALSGMINLTVLGHSQLNYVIFYVMIIIIPITGVLQVRYVTEAMQYYNATVVVPTFFVFFTLSAILAGIFFYGEFDDLTFLQVVIFVFGCSFSFLGVFFISSGRNSEDPPSSRSTEDDVDTGDQFLEPSCEFPCYNEMIQPKHEEEVPLLLGQEKPVTRAYTRDDSAESLFNPDQQMATDIPVSPKQSRKNKAKTSTPASQDRRTGDRGTSYPVSSGNTLFGMDLSWDPTADGSYALLDTVYRRVPPRTRKDDSSSYSSS